DRQDPVLWLHPADQLVGRRGGRRGEGRHPRPAAGMNAAVRWLILAAAVLLLANLGWWLLRDGGALPQRQASPAPQANSDPPPRPAQVSSPPVTRDEVPQPRTARAPAPVADAVDARRASPAGLLVPVQGVRPADL